MRIVIQFEGGPWDGKRVAGSGGRQDEAERYYALSYHGRVGQTFRTASEYAIKTLAREKLKVNRPHRFQPHCYEIAQRKESGDEVFLLAKYVRG